MEGQNLILIIQNDLGFLTPEKSFTLKELKLDTLTSTVVEGPIAWQIRTRRFFKEEGRLTADIISYSIPETEFPKEQLSMSEELKAIRLLSFPDIKTGLTQLSLGQGTKVRNPIVGERKFYPKYRLRPRVIDKIYRVPFEHVKFIDGGVQWSILLPKCNEEVEVFLPNATIRAEYDAVKGYFAKVLKVKQLRIHVKAEELNDEITLKEVNSAEVDRITEDILDKTRFEVYNNVKVDKGKFDINTGEGVLILEEEELLAELNKDLDLFSGDNLVEQIAELEKSLHYLQLSYLAKHQVAEESKLLFLAQPASFIFTLYNPNTEQIYLVWETVDTKEATYIWEYLNSTELDFRTLRKQVEATIRDITRMGKTAYLRQRISNFSRVIHDYKARSIEQGFYSWLINLQKVVGPLK